MISGSESAILALGPPLRTPMFSTGGNLRPSRSSDRLAPLVSFLLYLFSPPPPFFAFPEIPLPPHSLSPSLSHSLSLPRARRRTSGGASLSVLSCTSIPTKAGPLARAVGSVFLYVALPSSSAPVYVPPQRECDSSSPSSGPSRVEAAPDASAAPTPQRGCRRRRRRLPSPPSNGSRAFSLSLYAPYVARRRDPISFLWERRGEPARLRNHRSLST